MSTTIITIGDGHGLDDSQTWIRVMEEDNRWWKRFYCFIFRKEDPVIESFYSILSIDSNTQFTIKRI